MPKRRSRYDGNSSFLILNFFASNMFFYKLKVRLAGFHIFDERRRMPRVFGDKNFLLCVLDGGGGFWHFLCLGRSSPDSCRFRHENI